MPIFHRAALALALAWCFASSAALIAQKNPSSNDSDATYSVTGTVVDSVSGEPIRRALVQLRSMPPRSAFTSDEGRFELDAVPAGRFPIDARKPGYYDGAAQGSGPVSRDVRVGPDSDSVTLKLSPYGAIYGRITNVDGEPLEHIPVRLTGVTITSGRRRWDQIGMRDTDENGAFRFANLQPGTFYLAAGPSTEDRVPLRFTANAGPAKPVSGYSSVYFPSAPEISSASPLQLAPGQQMPIEFVLNRVPVYEVSGTVSGAMPEHGVALQVTTSGGDMLNVPGFVRPTTGAFKVQGLPAGSYVLRVFSQPRPGLTLRASAPITVAANLNDVRLTLEPTAEIPVVIRKESRNNNSAAQNSSAYRFGRYRGTQIPVQVHLSPVGQVGQAADIYSTYRKVNGEDSLVLENVEPGRYSVEFLPQAEWYVQSAEYGGTNLLTDDMVVSSRPASALEIVVRDDGASLEVAFKQPEDGGLANIILIPQRSGAKPIQLASLYGTGTTERQGLAPGDYFVLALENAGTLEYSNPQALEPYLSQATHVTLSASQTTHVDLTPIRAGDGSQ